MKSLVGVQSDKRILTIERIGLVALVLTVGMYLAHALSYREYTMEDAYISFRYAENWTRGLGFVFNPGEAVEGYTNFLWVVLLGVLHNFGMQTLLMAKVLGISFGIGTLFVTYKLGRLIAPQKNWTSYFAVVLLALYPGFAIWSVAGLETVLFTFLICLGIWFALLEPNSIWYKYGIVLALATLTRPEGLLFFGLVFLNDIFWSVLRREYDKRTLAHILVNLLPFLLIVGFWQAWRWSFYGYPLPNTFYLKTASAGPIAITQGFAYMSGFFNSLGGWLILGLGLLIVVTPSPKQWKTLFFGIMICWLLYIRQVNGDWMPWYRFFIPVLPLVLLAVQDALAALVNSAPKFALGLGIFLITLGAFGAAYTFRAEASSLAQYGQEAVAAGKWLHENAAPNDSIAVTNAGAIPYYSGLKTLDYYGLLDETISHMPFQKFALDLGDGTKKDFLLRIDVNWLLDQKPTYFEIPGTLKTDGSLSTYAPLTQVIFTSERFKQEYASQPIFVNGQEMIFKRK